MKLNVGFSKPEEIGHLAERGADEFHCGLLTNPKKAMFNHRTNDLQNNLKDYSELKEAVTISHKKECKIFFLVNADYYHFHKYPIIIKELKKIRDAGIDGFIISNLSLAGLVRDWGGKVILSSVFPLFNSKAIAFAQNLGISRAILPQHLNSAEVKQIVDNTSIETEVFFLKGNFCRNIDGLCRYHNSHLFNKEKDFDNYGWPCSLDFKSSDSGIKSKIMQSKNNKQEIMLDFYNNVRNNVDILKIGIRGSPLKRKKDVVTKARKLVHLAENLSQQDFVSRSLEVLRR